MKKKAVFLLAASMLSLTLGACGTNDTKTGSPADPGVAAGNSAEAGGTQADTVLNFKLAENQSADNPVSQGVEMFAELVREKTNGTVNIEVYLDGQLGSENETIDQVQAGTLDFARINTSALAVTVDSAGAFTLPYIFTDMDQKYKILDGEIGQEVTADLANYNMVGLEYWEAGSRCFYTVKKPISSVADIKGMKLRVQQSNVAIKMVELLGGAATPMSYGEVYQGLQTGVIDGAENDFVSYYTSGHYEVAKYYALDNHMSPPAMLLMSRDSWNKMSESQQAAVKEAAVEASRWQRTAMDEFQNEARAKVEEAGCTVNEVDMKEFQDKVTDIYAMYPQYEEIIGSMQAVK